MRGCPLEDQWGKSIVLYLQFSFLLSPSTSVSFLNIKGTLLQNVFEGRETKLLELNLEMGILTWMNSHSKI